MRWSGTAPYFVKGTFGEEVNRMDGSEETAGCVVLIH